WNGACSVRVHRRKTMKRVIFAVGLGFGLLATLPASAAKVSNVKRAWIQAFKQGKLYDTSNRYTIRTSQPKREKRYSAAHSLCDGASVVTLANPTGRKNTVAATTFALHMHTGGGVLDVLSVYKRGTEKLLATGQAVDGPFKWNKTPTPYLP